MKPQKKSLLVRKTKWLKAFLLLCFKLFAVLLRANLIIKQSFGIFYGGGRNAGRKDLWNKINLWLRLAEL